MAARKTPAKKKKTPPKKATPPKRAHDDDGTFKGDDPATPDVNEAWDPPTPIEPAEPEPPAPEPEPVAAEPCACANPACADLRAAVNAMYFNIGQYGSVWVDPSNPHLRAAYAAAQKL